MNFLAKISPRLAYQREAWRQMYEMAHSSRRSYDAGKYDRANRNWIATNESAQLTDRQYRDTVRARSRDLERNSDIFMGQVHPWVRNVVGKGFVLEAKSGNDEFDKEIERLWRKWCRKQNCDVEGTQSFWDMARMAIRRKKIDGGILFIKCYTPGGIVPFKLQAVEVDELASDHMTPNTPGNKVIDGVEYTGTRSIAGYWFAEYDIEGYTSLQARFVKAEDVIFYFSKNRPSQRREMPEMAHVLTRIKEINGFVEAATVKERMAACLSVLIKSVNPMPRFGNAAASDAGEKRDYNEMKLAPGMVTALNAGDDVEVINPASSATDGNTFIKTMTRLISAGQGISYEATSRDLSGTNYSSARQATIEDEVTFEPETEKIKDDFFDEVYEAFLTSAVMSGAISAPPDFEINKDRYLRHSWNKKPKRWIDPVKETNANRTAIASGQKTLTQIWGEDGRDYKDVMDEIKAQQDYAAEIGLVVGVPTIDGAPADK